MCHNFESYCFAELWALRFLWLSRRRVLFGFLLGVFVLSLLAYVVCVCCVFVCVCLCDVFRNRWWCPCTELWLLWILSWCCFAVLWTCWVFSLVLLSTVKTFFVLLVCSGSFTVSCWTSFVFFFLDCACVSVFTVTELHEPFAFVCILLCVHLWWLCFSP